MYGHQGKILKVDLSRGESGKDEYPPEFARMFLGGNGFAARLIRDGVPPDSDPLGPDNAMVFAVGPLTDSLIWGTSRGHMASISPLTGLFCDSNFGGDFATAQKRTGFDAISIAGRSWSPVYVEVIEEGALIHDASGLWGKSTSETMEVLQARHGPGAVCACVGPAGEKGVLYANVILGGKRPGASGRGGMGAVMGGKNLKALVVKGSRRTQVFDRKAITRLLKDRVPALKENTKPFKTYGTPFLVKMINSLGMLGTRNNSRETFDLAELISGEKIRENYWVRNVACHGCPVGCGKEVRVTKGRYEGLIVKMPEYETLFALGSMLDNGDMDSILNANHLCFLLGLDTISMGMTLAFVAECMEKGVISERDMGGRVAFSDGQALCNLIEKTGNREGIGEDLALGSSRLARRFGKEAARYLQTVKGMELAGHSSRGLRNMSLSYAVSTRGGSHHDGRPNYLMANPDPGFDPQPSIIIKNNCFTAVGDSLIMCRFIMERGFGTPLNDHHVNLLNAVTGWDLSLEDLERVGERVYNLERLINVERGVSRKDDGLPFRTLNEPIPDGPAKGRYCPKEELDRMLDKYYSLRGWDRDGIPTPKKLNELGLE